MIHKWIEQYPASVPNTINADTYDHLSAFFEDSFQRYRLQPMTICMGVSHTYGEIDELSWAVAIWLKTQNIPKGSVIALMMPNVPQYLPIFIGIIRAGYVCTPINPLYTGRELKHQLNDSKASVIFLIDNFAQALEQVVDETEIKHIVLSKMGDLMGLKGMLINMVIRNVKKLVPKYHLNNPKHRVYKFTDIIKQDNKVLAEMPISDKNDMAILQYTGGTTGIAKGAILTHRNVISAALQAEAWFRPATKKINTASINTILALPLYHIFAFMVTLLGMRSGHTFILIPNPRDMSAFIKSLSKQPFHVFPGVNTLFKALLEQPNLQKVDFSRLVVTLSGGMPANEQTARQWLEKTGCPMIEAWGLTECVAAGTANIITDQKFNGKIGLPIPSFDVSVRDDDGNEVGIGEAGELCIKGPNVTQGYYGQDNTNYFTHDGYFKTGDIGCMDTEGYFTLLDRKKDMILVSGFNVYPNEIESVLLECAGVVDCAAIGIPDDRQGESIKLYVVREDDNVTKDVIIDFAYDNLTGYKCPRYIEFIDDLPKSNVGKVLREKLREKHFQNA